MSYFVQPAKSRLLIPLLTLLIGLPILHSLMAQGVQSEVGKVFAGYDLKQITNRSTTAMVAAAKQFLEGLDKAFIADAKLPFNTPEKAVWSNLPPNLGYAGVRIADLNPTELQALTTLLATSLSPMGFEKVRGIMLGDDLLVRGDQTGNRMLFGADNYWFFIYGTPSTIEPWGWQFDGHHLAINLTIGNDAVTLSPSFIGTQPADVQWGEHYNHQPMAKEVNQAFALINSLNSEQRGKAIIGSRRQNLDAGPGADDVTPPTQGILGASLSPVQRTALGQLAGEWLKILPEKYATQGQMAIDATLEETAFGWWGKTEKQSPVYFRIQGPDVLIEFANQNLGGNPLQHLHSVYRNPRNDYGRNF